MSTAEHHVSIRPTGGGAGNVLAELWEFRELLYFLTKKELQVRYKQSFFGAGWAVLQPIGLTAIFSLIFGRLVNVPSEGVPYPLYVLTGMTVWIFVATGTAQAAASLVGESELVTKVYFPRLVIPLAKVLSWLVDLVIALVVLIVVAGLYGRWPPLQVLTVPLWVGIAIGTVVGVGVLASAVNVKYRDVVAVLPLAIQVWLFLSPVAYPASLVHGGLKYLYAVNPMVSAIGGMRWAMLGTPAPAGGQIAVSVGAVLLVLAAAFLYFRRTERYFADIV
jgi:lipopolysaccharide transport system permease protein